MRVRPCTVLRLWSEDAFNGVLRSVDDLSSAKVDLRFVNPQTGPFYVEGAEPGDTLVLHLVALEPARDWGASAAIPFFGGMTSARLWQSVTRVQKHGTQFIVLNGLKVFDAVDVLAADIAAVIKQHRDEFESEDELRSWLDQDHVVDDERALALALGQLEFAAH
jgi:acetamidase/formamidase